MAFCSAPRGTGSRLMIRLERWKMAEDRITIEGRERKTKNASLNNDSHVFKQGRKHTFAMIRKEEWFIPTKKTLLFAYSRERYIPSFISSHEFRIVSFFLLPWKLYHRTDNRPIWPRRRAKKQFIIGYVSLVRRACTCNTWISFRNKRSRRQEASQQFAIRACFRSEFIDLSARRLITFAGEFHELLQQFPTLPRSAKNNVSLRNAK